MYKLHIKEWSLKFLWTFAFTFFSISAFSLPESDRILSFHSDVKLDKSGLITVTETIKVYNGDGVENSENNLIQRGIIRSFPTIYRTRRGLNSKVGFKLLKVFRDGEYEAHQIKKGDNGVFIYLGQSHILLDKGIYTYEITYQTDRQMLFHSDKDEFYWNVNGNGWDFTADKVSCTIHFPEEAEIFEYDCYTGIRGSKEKDCKIRTLSSNTVFFETTKNLKVYEGLTVAAAVKKGVFIYPTVFQKLKMVVLDNLIIPIAILIFLLITFVNYFIWRKVGKDPYMGNIYPQFSPPENMSPADVGYSIDQKYSHKLFVASLVDHAVRKFLEIDVREEGSIFKKTVYKFRQPKLIKNDFRDEKMYEWYDYDIERLYGIEVKKGEYLPVISSMNSGLSNHLKDRIEKQNENKQSFNIFKSNDGFIALGALLLVIMAIACIVYLSIYPYKTLVIFCSAMFILSLTVHILFSRIMNAYTNEGRKIADHILGFKMYLETTEEKFYDQLTPPELSIQLFEKYLPYAIALGCENRWADKCKSVIETAINNGYTPTYYSMSSGRISTAAFAGGIASGLSGTISSASTPPSSSSGGSSGGGSSGGGGGGGGGSGW